MSFKTYLGNKRGNKNGFTLIELLVVIAIIGLLSSVVLASLSSARKKAKDAAIKESAHQLATLMALEYSENNSYCKLQPTARWITSVAGCNDASVFSGTYMTKAREICTNMYNNAKDYLTNVGYRMYIGTNPYDCGKSYSFMIMLNNYTNKVYCFGSSGRKGEYTPFTGGGCYTDP